MNRRYLRYTFQFTWRSKNLMNGNEFKIAQSTLTARKRPNGIQDRNYKPKVKKEKINEDSELEKLPWFK